MTTTDNLYIYTCPQAFNDIKPSRDENTEPSKVRATTIYDPMGRTTQQMEQRGIYIVFEELENGETRAHKVAIYE